MECFNNITSNYSHNGSIAKRHQEVHNSTNSSAADLFNKTNKILFCKSKALFFKQIYKALKNEKSGSEGSKVAIVQTTGKSLSKLMDKDCFADSYIDDNQLYNI